MAQYGYCENCGSTLELVGCPNCDEIEVNEYYDDLHEINSQIYTCGKE
jgi:hypothetical protein